MLRFEQVNGFARILEFGTPLVDVVFSHSPTEAQRRYAVDKILTMIEQVEDAPRLEKKVKECIAELAQVRSENAQMRDTIAELKRNLKAFELGAFKKGSQV